MSQPRLRLIALARGARGALDRAGRAGPSTRSVTRPAAPSRPAVRRMPGGFGGPGGFAPVRWAGASVVAADSGWWPGGAVVPRRWLGAGIAGLFGGQAPPVPGRRAAAGGGGFGRPGLRWRRFGGASAAVRRRPVAQLGAQYIKAHGGGTMAVSSQTTAENAIIDNGARVAGIGGFSGNESEVTAAWLAQEVRSGKIRWVLDDDGRLWRRLRRDLRRPGRQPRRDGVGQPRPAAGDDDRRLGALRLLRRAAQILQVAGKS